jgi:hypothetical protein
MYSVVYPCWHTPDGCGCVDNLRDTSRQGKFLTLLRIEWKTIHIIMKMGTQLTAYRSI